MAPTLSFRNAGSLDVQLVYLAILVPVGIFCSRFTEVGAFVKEAYRKFEEAGPVNVKVPFPMTAEASLMTGSYAAHLMRGELDDPGVAVRIERDNKLLDVTQHNLMLLLLQVLESCWEPQCSHRVSHWNVKLAELSSVSSKPQVFCHRLTAVVWPMLGNPSWRLLRVLLEESFPVLKLGVRATVLSESYLPSNLLISC